MSAKVKIGGMPFACVPLAQADFEDIAATYVVLCVAPGGEWKVLDVGETGALGDRIDSHDRKDCWRRNCLGGNIWVCVYPMPSDQHTPEDRRVLERAIRLQYRPPCGKR